MGSNPTFSGTVRTVEAYVLDVDEDFYGHEVGVDFVARLRGQERYDDLDALVAAIRTTSPAPVPLLGPDAHGCSPFRHGAAVAVRASGMENRAAGPLLVRNRRPRPQRELYGARSATGCGGSPRRSASRRPGLRAALGCEPGDAQPAGQRDAE